MYIATLQFTQTNLVDATQLAHLLKGAEWRGALVEYCPPYIGGTGEYWNGQLLTP